MQTDRKTLTSQLRELEYRLSYTRELLITKAIDTVDFREMKEDYTAQIERLVAKITELGDDQPLIENSLRKGITNLFSLADAYKKAGIDGKREIISSTFPEKLSFDGTTVRTIRVND